MALGCAEVRSLDRINLNISYHYGRKEIKSDVLQRRFYLNIYVKGWTSPSFCSSFESEKTGTTRSISRVGLISVSPTGRRCAMTVGSFMDGRYFYLGILVDYYFFRNFVAKRTAFHLVSMQKRVTFPIVRHVI